MLRDLFKKAKSSKYAVLDIPGRAVSPGDDEMIKCECGEIIYCKDADLEKYHKVCKKCSCPLKLSAMERISLILDTGSFVEYDSRLESKNPLNFPEYEDKLTAARESTGLNEAVVTGEGTIENIPLVIGVMDQFFISASMGSVVGEKITRAMEKAVERKLPIVIFSASGGARMQEGLLSLMQMAKTSAAVARLNQEGLLFISVLTNPTTGGVTASFASLGDIIIAEPQALIGFAGPRVIEQTIRQKLPTGFQRAEFQLQHGMVDMIVERKDLRRTLSRLLLMHKRV